jgi:2-oxoisovalerate dehydrogenase E1 component alpha subunit
VSTDTSTHPPQSVPSDRPFSRGLMPAPMPVQFLDDQGQRVQVFNDDYPEPSREQLVAAYSAMVIGRRFDIQATTLAKQGRLAVYPAARGQEACQIGSMLALSEDDWAFPTYRDSMALVTRGLDPVEVLTSPHGAAHCGYDPRASRTAPQCTPLATQLIHAVGFASGEQRRGRPTVAMAFVGDGGTSEGDFHEALNFAAVFKAPVVFLVQNNTYAISTPLSKQTAAPSLGYKGIGYGIASEQIDGNDAMAVLAVLNKAVVHARSGQGPVLVEAHTYRLDAHTNADDATRYRDSGEVADWLRRDPIARLEAWLRHEGLIDDAFVETVAAKAEAFAADLRMRMSVDQAVDPMSLFDNVFATPTPQLLEERAMVQAELEAEEASR